MINPSSKISLKMTCLASCRGDIDQASKLYGFLADGIESIPDFDIPRPSAFEQIKHGAGEVFSWVKNNREDIMQAVSFVQSLRKDSPSVESATEQQSIPPLPKE